MHSAKFALFAIVLAAAGTPPGAQAQVPFPVAAPEPKVGEVARYKTTDLWSNKELSSSETQVVEIQADRFIVRTKRSDQPEARTLQFTRQWEPCRSMQNSDKMVCAGSFKFPMQVGGKHRYENLPWPNGAGHSSGDCEVKGEEKVSVPAGTFDTVRVECAGYWNRVFGGTFSGRQVETHWYAPKISRVVKTHFTDYNSGAGGVANKTLTELIELQAK